LRRRGDLADKDVVDFHPVEGTTMMTQDPRHTGSGLVEPHRRLMAAVLQTVVDDRRGSVYRRARGYGMPIARRHVRKATAYVTSTDRTWPFSFENLCEALGLDAGRLRRELRTIPVFALPEVGIPLG
jgi:hypothetical protein